MEDRDEIIAECKVWLANRRARLDQKEKQFQDQYPLVSPETNKQRMEDLEAWKFNIEVQEWELKNFVEEGDTSS